MTLSQWHPPTCIIKIQFPDKSLDEPPVLRIRLMTEEDVPIVSAIDRQSFSLPWPDRSFLFEIRENENSIPLVAEVDNPDKTSRVVGFIVVWLILDEAHIGTIAVDDAYRKTGIAENLIRTALRNASAGGALKAFLEVRAGNQPARNLYEKLGFQVDGVRPKYYQDNHEDAVLMSLQSFDEL